jgi:DNA replication protein DnaC
MTQILANEDHRIAASWSFWINWFKTHPGKTPISNIRIANVSDILINRTCPFCNNAEIFKILPGPKEINGYRLETVTCICCILRYATREPRSEESSWQKRKVADIQAVNNPPGAAEYTEIIKSEVTRFIMKLGKWIYLNGTYGTGKTHFLYAAKTNLRNISTYINAADLADKIYEATGNHTINDLINSLIGIPILLVDDLGAEHTTDYLYSVLYKVVNGRYALGIERPTFITSNLSLEDLARSPNDNLQRIASRLSDNAMVSYLISKQGDYRGLKR